MQINNWISSEELKNKIYDKLKFLYGEETAGAYAEKLARLTERYRNKISIRNGKSKRWFDERDVVLITYGDQIRSDDGKSPLRNLEVFLNENYAGIINTVHLLPFYPWSSDDGFAVTNYYQVNRELGTWEDIKGLSRSFCLMFDAVINHVSSQSEWFQEYLKGNPAYQGYFIEAEAGQDLSCVARPRTLPLLTEFRRGTSRVNLWTTFSKDQIDLNYTNPEVLLKIVDLLLFYICMGASMLRLDAIGYLWKKPGTSCINLAETHTVVQLFKDMIDSVIPGIKIVTETNVPHRENISYFGDGYNEAQMVYQFALPPLVLHAFLRGNAEFLTDWADNLEFPSDKTTYFNFLASHDGIGLMPVKGILPDEEIQELCIRACDRGGCVSYRNNPDGSVSPYELNIVYFNAVVDPKETVDRQAEMFLTAYAIMLCMKGVPGIYIHSLVGSQNDTEGVKKTGRVRSINRKKFQRDELRTQMENNGSVSGKVTAGMKRLIGIRTRHKAFHPDGLQKIIRIHPSVFALLRCSPDRTEKILCLHNVSGSKQRIEADLKACLPYCQKEWLLSDRKPVDLLGGDCAKIREGRLEVVLNAYQAAWYKLDSAGL